MDQGGNYWTLFTPGIWKDLHAVSQARALARFGEAPMRYRGNAPRVLLMYKAAQGEPAKRSIAGTAGKVEVLGRGQQFVAYGTHHSGATLHWTPEGPMTWAAEALPSVTEEDVAAFLAEVAPLIGASAQGTVAPDDTRQASALGQRGELLKVLVAVDAIPNDGPADWEAWNRIGMAIWAATDGAEAGREAWHAWSKRHPNYDADATDERWDHYRSSPPAQLGAGTLFHVAAAATRSHAAEMSAEVHLSDPARPSPNAEWWITRDIKRPEPLLGEVITTTTRLMIGGPTGIGKSHLAMGIGAALATGLPFAHWHVHRAVRVLYIDGEMARDLVQERIADLKRRLGGADLSNLYVVCREDFPHMEPLNTPAGRAFVETLVKRWRIEFVIFDNRMSLLSGDMKEETPWTETMELVRSLTRSGVAQLWIDHTGHDKTKIYGSSTKEWQLDAVALLTKAERPDAEIAFKLEFTKARRRRPDTRRDFEAVTLCLRGDDWAVDGATVGTPRGTVPPIAMLFYRALQEASRASATLGRATRSDWYAECVRRGIVDQSPSDAGWRERDRRKAGFRKYMGKLKAARMIEVDGNIVTDLGRPSA